MKRITIFYINNTSEVNVRDIILDLNVNKATSKDSIPTKLRKENFNILSPILCNNFNTGVGNNTFPPTLKSAGIKPTYKKDDRGNKENYRPVSLLPFVSKIFQEIRYAQISPYFDPILSPTQCGFRKVHSAQHYLLVLLEKWKTISRFKESSWDFN